MACTTLELIQAWKKKNLELFKKVLNSGCNPNEICWEEDFRPILSILAETNRTDKKEYALALLNSTVDLNEQLNGLCPIHRAAREGNLEILQVLLENKVNVNTRDIYGNTAMHYLAKKKWTDDEKEILLKCAQLLLEQPDIDLNVKKFIEEKETPIHEALKADNLEVLQLILDNFDSFKIDENCKEETRTEFEAKCSALRLKLSETPEEEKVLEVLKEGQVEEVSKEKGEENNVEILKEGQVKDVPKGEQVEEIPKEGKVEETSINEQVVDIPKEEQVEKTPKEESPKEERIEEIAKE